MAGNWIAPWGKPGTALVPLHFRERFKNTPGPKGLGDRSSKELALGDLGPDFWDHYGDAFRDDDLDEIVSIVSSLIPHVEAEAVIPRHWQISSEVSQLPLRARTSNALRRQDIARVSDLSALSIADVLEIRTLGVRSLVDLLCVLESAAQVDWSTQVDEHPPRDERPEIYAYRQAISVLGRHLPIVAGWAKEELELETLGELLRLGELHPPAEIDENVRALSDIKLHEIASSEAERFSVSACIRRLLERLDDRDLVILRDRVVALSAPQTLEVLGQRLGGVTRERVRQIEAKVRARLTVDQLEGPLARRAGKVRAQLGVAVPIESETVERTKEWALRDLQDFDDSVVWPLLVYLGGPYRSREGWLIAADLDGLTEALKSRFAEGDFLSDASFDEVMDDVGINSEARLAWIEKHGRFKRVDGGWLIWDGSALDKLERVLYRRGAPATAAELLAEAGEERSVRGIHTRMIEDPRFVRINRQGQFALPGWGFDEYSGITAEIAQEVERCGGVATEDHLIETISSRYGVSPSSVQVYLNAPMFMRAATGGVRLREATDAPPDIKQDLSSAPDCFCRDGKWSLRIRVDNEVARGSGRGLPASFAAHVGVLPGDKRTLSTPYGPVVVSWPMTAAMGPALGSTRAVAEALGAQQGDLIFLEFNGERLVPRLVAEGALGSCSGPSLAALVMGLDREQSSLAELASALGIQVGEEQVRQETEKVLRVRRDIEILRLLPVEITDDDMDSVLRRLDQALS